MYLQGLMRCELLYSELFGVGFSVRNMLVGMSGFFRVQNKAYELWLFVHLLGAAIGSVVVVIIIDSIEKHWVETMTHLKPKFHTQLIYCEQVKGFENHECHACSFLPCTCEPCFMATVVTVTDVLQDITSFFNWVTPL